MKKIRLFFLVLIFLNWVYIENTSAQYSDAGLWTSVTIEKKFSDQFSILLNQELRLHDNISRIGSIFTEAGLNYKFNKIFRIGFYYRYNQKLEGGNFSGKRSRYYLDFSARKKIRKFIFIDRIRAQSQFNDYFSSEKGHTPFYHLRNMVLLKFEANKKITPFIAGELFYQLNNPEGNELDNFRLKTGINYSLNKNSNLDLGYMFQREINVNDPVTAYVIMVGYAYEF